MGFKSEIVVRGSFRICCCFFEGGLGDVPLREAHAIDLATIIAERHQEIVHARFGNCKNHTNASQSVSTYFLLHGKQSGIEQGSAEAY